MNDLKPMFTAAVMLHEVYESYVQAGFSRKEALYLAGKIVEGMFATATKPAMDQNDTA